MTTFSDDSYNKDIPGKGVLGPGTLIGNWYEEAELRGACGEGRCVPQRHLPRSGLLKDFTKMPSGGPRLTDNTFDRICGAQEKGNWIPQSRLIGSGETDIFGDTPLAPTLQAEGRIPRTGKRSQLMEAAMMEAAEQATGEEDVTTDAINKQRFFETTVGAHYTKPDEALAERALLVRPNCKSEILRGPPPDRTRTLANAGLHIAGHTHYSKLEPLTYQRIALADPRMCADVKASAASGVSAFGRNTEFSKPISECNLGLSKDEEVDMMYSSLKSTLPHRTLPGSQPSGAAFAGIPSLAAVKETLHDYVANTYGPFGYVILRQRLFDISDEEGFAKKAEVLALIRSELCLSPDVMSDQILNAYLQQLVTMKKHELHVGSLMTSLRPALPPSTKKTVLEAFQRLCPQDGAIPLGAWLGRLSDESLQRTLVGAFGGMGGIDDVAGVPVTEAIFIELLSDLAPLTDVDALLFRI